MIVLKNPFKRLAKSRVAYDINVKGGDYSLRVFETVNRSLFLKFYTVMKRKSRGKVKQGFGEVEQDTWTIEPSQFPILDPLVGGVSKKMRKQVKAVEREVRKKHPAFRILSHSLEGIDFEKQNDRAFKMVFRISGICV